METPNIELPIKNSVLRMCESTSFESAKVGISITRKNRIEGAGILKLQYVVPKINGCELKRKVQTR
jgi:hypothetical protein